MLSTLRDALAPGGRPALIGRNGSIELAAIVQPGSINREVLERHCGVWPATTIGQWRAEYIEANGQCDVIAAGWYAPLAQHELEMLQRLNPAVTTVPLRALEPYYVPPNERWTTLLSGKRVTVVSSFTDTMRSQLQKRREVWGNDSSSLLPDASFSFVRTGYAPLTAGSSEARWPVGVACWQDAVANVVQRVVATKPDVVLIGCGGLGMVIGCRLKRLGITSVVMGGAIQVLFGIKGRRWETHPVISKFWNEHWRYPAADETPERHNSVEGSCYWSK